MIDIAEIQKRALSGPILKENAFDLKFSEKVGSLVKKYNIVYHREEIIPDDATADSIFNAGVELLADVGVYHLNTNRVVQCTKDEISEIVKTRPREVTFGDGKDEVIFRERTPEEKRPLVVIAGPTGGVLTEELFIPVMRSFAQEEACQGIVGGSLISVRGIQNKLGTPAELTCVIGEARYLREVAISVGKPGMYIGMPFSGVSSAAVFSAFFPEGYTKKNAQMPIHIFPELKFNWDRLIQAEYAIQHGIVPWTSVWPVIGAYCRSPEEAAVASIAETLGQLLYGHGSNAFGGSANIHGISSVRDCLWASAAAGLASERNIHIPFATSAPSTAGPCTEMSLYEKAALTIMATASGMEWLWGQACCSANVAAVNHQAGLETRMVRETARAVAGVNRKDVNSIINKVVARYEERLSEAPMGKAFPECYDLKTIKPSQEYLDLYDKVKDELGSLGISWR